MATKDIPDDLICRTVAEIWSRREAGEKGLWLNDLLHERTGEPMKVCYCAMERAYDRGLIECGVSLRGAWLTDKGKSMLS
ncbi:hypothetical protein AH2_00015 [Burkholderia phage vB_BceS_AH2]|uniref:Uncharacterized protein n=1 Tax=Burkholderia phage vB_BceS_AH2 TaxID=1133022 RepID=I6NSR2_9CAUD|nr:hypothetical protein B613_gp15 [Burkholderia phage vB_BceS_AH2]AEY69526.1 hypothetical protein AH2_00015 [Burkholderia phage vB_BceS_AH2]